MQAYNKNGVLIHDAEPYYGKKWTLFGDSLTDDFGGDSWEIYDGSSYPDGDSRKWVGYKFASRIARELNLTIDNRAESGSNIYYSTSGTYASVNGVTILDNFLAEIANDTIECPEYITVAFGTNSSRTSIGTDADTSATNTSVYGATKYYIEKLLELQQTHTEMVFGFVLSPMQSWGTSDTGHDIDGARTAIKTVCESYGIPYVDMSKVSGIQVSELVDGIHISDKLTNTKYYHALRRFMRGL